MKQLFSVPDMSCDHCRRRIEDIVGGSEGVESVDVNLETKTVTVLSDLEPQALVDLFDQAGYDAALREKISE